MVFSDGFLPFSCAFRLNMQCTRLPDPSPSGVIISFTPGSSTDIVARIVMQKVSEYWGQPVVIENRAGAGGSIGSNVVAQGGARRLHAADQFLRARGQPGDLRQAALRHDRRISSTSCR